MYVVLNTFENNKNAINVKNHEIIHVFKGKNHSLKCCNTIGAFYNVKWDFTFKETFKLK
jgi:hypothetical protein